MALVGQAATIAQLAGVDAYGLIKMIAEAAQTVRRNKATCLQLARRAKMIGDLLHQLHAAQLMQHPETRNPVEQLEETLRRALLLVRSCQGRSYLYRCFMGGRHADELCEVQSEITFYLQLFPLVSYVDTTLTWVRLLNKAAPDPSCKEAPMDYKVPGSKAQLLVPLDQCKEISMPPSHDSILQVPKDQIRDYKVPGSEVQLLVPLDQCKEISMPPSHDSILQVPKDQTRDYKVPGSEAQSLVPLDQCKDISIPPSQDSILQVPKLARVLHHT